MKIGQCAILSAGMSYGLTYGSHKWPKKRPKMALKYNFYFLSPNPILYLLGEKHVQSIYHHKKASGRILYTLICS